MNDLKELEVKEAIEIILSDKARYTTTLNYAVHYCQSARPLKGHDLKVQCLYILSNITSWRNPEAKRVRTILKNFTK